MGEVPEVSYINPESFSRFVGHDVTVVVTDTGRTYAVIGSKYSCYFEKSTGEYFSHAQHFIMWFNKLEKSNEQQ
jgi:F420-0:gamma-glutamyl ligase-like protein